VLWGPISYAIAW